MIITRRSALLSTSALAAAVLLSACTESTTNGVTTITLNVAKTNAWMQAAVNGANLIAGLPGISGTATSTTMKAIGSVLSTALAAFNTASNGSVSLQFTTASVPAAIQDLETDANTLLSDGRDALTGIAATYLQTAQTYVAAVETVVSLFVAAIGSVTAAASLNEKPQMPEAQALSMLGVK